MTNETTAKIIALPGAPFESIDSIMYRDYQRLLNDWMGMKRSRDEYKSKYKSAKKVIKDVKFRLASAYVEAAGMA